MDAGLAKVLNSTVGTTNFKSFDELLAQDKCIAATDEKYFVFPEEMQKWGTDETLKENVVVDVFSFALPLSGSCNLKYRIGLNWNDADGTMRIKVLKNNEEYITHSHTSSHINNSAVQSMLLEGEKGDSFLVSVYHTASQDRTRLYLNLLSIDASVVHSKPITVEYFV